MTDGLDGFDAQDDGARPDIAELLPVDRFAALLELIGEQAEVLIAAEEEVAPALADNWSDVCAAATSVSECCPQQATSRESPRRR